MGGLPVVIVALAAVTQGRLARAGAAVALVVIALLRTGDYGTSYEGWHLLLAAVLVVMATWGWSGAVGGATVIRSLWGRIPGRPKDLAVLIVVVVAAVWLVLSFFAPAQP